MCTGSSVQAECQGRWASCLALLGRGNRANGMAWVSVHPGHCPLKFVKKHFVRIFLKIAFSDFPRFCSTFVNMGPYENKIIKTLPLSQQKYCFWVLKFRVSDVSGLFSVLVNVGPYGNENFKTLLLQIAFKLFQTPPEFSSRWTVFEVSDITIFEKCHFHHCNTQGNQTLQ